MILLHTTATKYAGGRCTPAFALQYTLSHRQWSEGGIRIKKCEGDPQIKKGEGSPRNKSFTDPHTQFRRWFTGFCRI